LTKQGDVIKDQGCATIIVYVDLVADVHTAVH